LRFQRYFSRASIGFAIAGALVGCSGSSSGVAPSSNATTTPTPGPTATATATPTAAPTATPTVAPAANVFVFSGSMTQTFTLYGTPGPSAPPHATAAPTATPWITTLAQSVTQDVSAHIGASLHGRTGLAVYETVEADTNVHESTTTTSDTYVALVPDATRVSGIDVTDVATISKDSNGVALEHSTGTGNGIVNELPVVPYSQWTDTASRTNAENDPGGEDLTATYAGDGSYHEQITYSEGGVAAVQENSDGSGVYQVPLVGETNQNSTITVSAPAATQHGDALAIAYSIYGVGLPAAGGFLIPVWYPSVPPILASDTYENEGAATIPQACGVPQAYASGTFDEIVEKKVRLDTVFGELETDRDARYVSDTFGVVCVIRDDDLKNYYDFSGQSDSVLSFSSIPLEGTAVTEVLSLQSAGLATASRARSARAASQSPMLAALPSSARVEAIFSQARLRELHALYGRFHLRTIR
jgi:hypothetical protein